MNNNKDLSPNGIRMLPIGHVEISDEVMFSVTADVDDLPIIPTRNLVLFPKVTIPITLIRESSLKTARAAKERHLAVGIVCQKDPDIENPVLQDLNNYGVIASIIDIIKLPDDTFTAIVKAEGKFKVLGSGDGHTLPEAEISAKIKQIKEVVPKSDDVQFSSLVACIETTIQSITQRMGKSQAETEFFVKMMQSPNSIEERINHICTSFPVETEIKFSLLSCFRLRERAMMLYENLARHEEMLNITERVQQRAKESFDDQQRRMFLQRQMEAIDQELNGDNSEIAELRKRYAELPELPPGVSRLIERTFVKLERINQQSPDYTVEYSYLDTVLSLPWPAAIEYDSYVKIDSAREQLDSDHYGLDKVKERILEQIAVVNRVGVSRAPILCLVGPPGVGKTSLGKSIAAAMGRKYQRVSLGGLHDESEIRGHRRTYVGAMPGRIMEAIIRAGTSNPVIVLDEIDKVGVDYKGDPSAALLEVLDPEQNCRFHDNYIDVDFDLSNILFIATANTLNGVQQPLIDRMEVIEIPGYLTEEKMEIARRHLIPSIHSEMALDDEQFKLDDDALKKVIENYTSESGVRQLGKELHSIARKKVLRSPEGCIDWPIVKSDEVVELLGAEKFTKERYEGNSFPGVVTGLAWTAVGGEILFVESSLSAGKGEKLTITGNLGDVMKESAMIALQYVKAHAEEIGIDPAKFETNNIHIHVPEGAIPKDGPSAGITMATSIASIFTGRLVRERLAMTGEITLRGKVMPVGGIREKILAAKRAGITDIILSKENRRNIEEIEERYRSGLTFHYVDTVAEVLALALI